MNPFTSAIIVGSIMVLSGACYGQQAAPSKHPTPDQALNFLETAIDTITSFDVRVDCVTRHLIITEGSEVIGPGGIPDLKITGRRILQDGERPQQRHQRFRQVFQRGSGRMEVYDTAADKPLHLIVYDMETEKVWTPKHSLASIQQPTFTKIADGADYLGAYRNAIGFVELAKCLRQRSVRIVESPHGPRFYTIDASVGKPDPGVDLPRWGMRVTIDTHRHAMPEKIELFRKSGSRELLILRREITEWVKTKDAVWVPSKIMTRHFWTDEREKDLLGRVADEVELRVDLSSSNWNQLIPQSVFQLSLPVGTRLNDALHKATYVTGKPDPGDNLDKLISEAKNIKPMREAKPPTSPSTWKRYVTIFGVAFFIVLLLIMFRILRGRTTRNP